MKRYLLAAGSIYYHGSSDEDWIGIYETKAEAELAYQDHVAKSKARVAEYSKRPYSGEEDWYDIIDLQTWEK